MMYVRSLKYSPIYGTHGGTLFEIADFNLI